MMKPKLKEHIYRQLVNDLTETASHYAGTQQLRGRLSSVVNRYIDTGCHRKGEITMDEAIKRRSAEWSVSNSGFLFSLTWGTQLRQFSILYLVTILLRFLLSTAIFIGNIGFRI